jgi:Amt family ammonium transporter
VDLSEKGAIVPLTIPHALYMAFQATFCIITAALISGAIVERMRFSAYVVFITVWSIVVYARWRTGCGAAAFLGRHGRVGLRRRHRGARQRGRRPALVAVIALGKRQGYPSSSLLPHSVPLCSSAPGLLWFGWFGFNAGSALAASPIAGLAFVTTMLAPAGTLVVWTAARLVPAREVHRRGRRDGHRRGPGGHHPRGRLHQPDERPHPGRDCRRPELLRADHPRQDLARRTRSTWWPAHGVGRHGGRAAHRRVRREGAQRLFDGALYGNPGQVAIPGGRRWSPRSSTAAWSASSAQGHSTW